MSYKVKCLVAPSWRCRRRDPVEEVPSRRARVQPGGRTWVSLQGTKRNPRFPTIQRILETPSPPMNQDPRAQQAGSEEVAWRRGEGEEERALLPAGAQRRPKVGGRRG